MAALFLGSEYDLCLWGNLKQKVYILEQLKLLKNIKDQFVKCIQLCMKITSLNISVEYRNINS